jgi:hypothetical protein
MRPQTLFTAAAGVCLIAGLASVTAQQATPATATPQVPAAQPAPPPVPGGLFARPQTMAVVLADMGGIPVGFTRIFNGRDLTGGHVCKSSHLGTAPA